MIKYNAKYYMISESVNKFINENYDKKTIDLYELIKIFKYNNILYPSNPTIYFLKGILEAYTP